MTKIEAMTIIIEFFEKTIPLEEVGKPFIITEEFQRARKLFRRSLIQEVYDAVRRDYLDSINPHY